MNNTWRYNIVKKGSTYRIAEYYGKEFGYTETPLELESNSRKGLIQMLEWMLSDAKRYRTIVEETK